MLRELSRRYRAAAKWSRLDSTSSRKAYRLAQQYLEPMGWFKSVKERQSVDHDGPIPWYTYPFLGMLPRLVRPNLRVFEYGCGNSSLWWAQRVEKVVSVEHDEAWYRRTEAAPNQELHLVPAGSRKNARHEDYLGEFFKLPLEPRSLGSPELDSLYAIPAEPFKSYASEILNYPDAYFDVIVIDGMARVLTTWVAVRRLKSDGFIIFDNSDRDVYDDAYQLLKEAGFLRLDFWGLGPINPYAWCTSLFARDPRIFQA